MTDLARIERELRAVPARSRRARQVNGLYQVFREPDYPALAALVGRWLEAMLAEQAQRLNVEGIQFMADFANARCASLQARLDAAERERQDLTHQVMLRGREAQTAEQAVTRLRGALEEIVRQEDAFVRESGVPFVDGVAQAVDAARAALAGEPEAE